MLRNLLGHGFRRVLTPSLRQYATEAPAASSGQGKLILNLVLPHQSLIHKKPVHQVNLSSTSGDMGILANHVPIIEELRPGVLEVIELNQNKTKYFVSGGFATMHPDSTLSINAVEAFTLDSFDPELVRTSLAEANVKLSTSKDAYTQAEAKIQIEVLSAIQYALSH